MPLIKKRSPKLRFQFVRAQKQSTLGGLPALEALAQQFDLWKKIRALPGLDTTHSSSALMGDESPPFPTMEQLESGTPLPACL